MKVGIVTINDNINYGNRLQNYAVQEILKEFSDECITIRNEPYNDLQYVNENVPAIKQIETKLQYTVIFANIIKLKKRVTRLIRQDEKRANNYESIYLDRIHEFEIFNKKYIQESQYVLSEYSKEPKDIKSYDFFITGSDQVWNPYYKRANYIYFLQFAPKEKRIALSASFGITEYPTDREKQLKYYIDGMNAISVREQSGKTLIQKYSNKETSVLIDPTLALGREKWIELERIPKKEIEGSYIITFFIGERTEEQNKFITKYARDNSYKIVNLNDKCCKEWFNIAPDEYIYLIHHSDCIFTDSFHACIFSIIFHKTFYAFNRVDNDVDMSTRLIDLLSTFDLNDYYFSADNYQVRKEISESKYNSIDKKIEIEKERLLKWLKDKI